MAGKIGICGLCRDRRELRESHLLPAAVYKLSRDPFRKNPNPVMITGGKSFTTSSQVAAPFLCADCEGRFSRDGEQYVLSHCARPNGEFKVRSLLQAADPILVDERFRIYDVAQLPKFQSEKFLYFAASVFWRAAARSWEFDSRKLRRLSLGDKYQEQLRRYLLGEAGFPINARLVVQVWSDARIEFTTTLPSSYRVEGTWRHKFCIPGITFILFLGGDAARKYDKGALNGSQTSRIWLCQWHNDSLFRGFVQAIAGSTPHGSLGRRTKGAGY